MYKITKTYTDFNGVERTEDFYFNLTTAELTEMQLGTAGGYVDTVQAIIKANETPELIKLFKDLLLKSYGEKSADGRRFIKHDADGHPLSISFSQTEAYSEIFMELATVTDAASAFVNGILPAKLVEEANKEALAKASN